MNIRNFIIACVIFIILDGTWIMINNNYYNNLAIKIQKEPIELKIPAIIITYILLFISLFFCIRYIELETKFNIDKNKNYLKIIPLSILFGLTVYGIYSYTTSIFLKNYNYTNAIIDTLWGGVLYSIPSIIYFSL